MSTLKQQQSKCETNFVYILKLKHSDVNNFLVRPQDVLSVVVQSTCFM